MENNLLNTALPLNETAETAKRPYIAPNILILDSSTSVGKAAVNPTEGHSQSFSIGPS